MIPVLSCITRIVLTVSVGKSKRKIADVEDKVEDEQLEASEPNTKKSRVRSFIPAKPN